MVSVLKDILICAVFDAGGLGGHPLRKDYPLGYEEVQFDFNAEELRFINQTGKIIKKEHEKLYHLIAITQEGYRMQKKNIFITVFSLIVVLLISSFQTVSATLPSFYNSPTAVPDETTQTV